MNSSLVRRSVLAAALAAPFAGARPAAAHHSFAMFDSTRRVTLVGTVREFQWTNPHCWVQLTVVSGAGVSAEWAVEALSPNVLGRIGWKRNIIKPGDKVSVVINPLRDGKNGGNLVSITLPDGRVLGGGAA